MQPMMSAYAFLGGEDRRAMDTRGQPCSGTPEGRAIYAMAFAHGLSPPLIIFNPDCSNFSFVITQSVI
jgi:hypothetical protein